MQEINSHPALKETINLVEIVGVFHLSQFHKYIKFWGIKNYSKIYGIILMFKTSIEFEISIARV